MASARIAAGLILPAATAKQAEIEAALAAWHAEQIEKVKAQPKVEGPFWARRYSVRTADEAEAELALRQKDWDSKEFWEEFNRPSRGLGKSIVIQQLARAALSDGDGFVTLDADEVRFLGLAVQS